MPTLRRSVGIGLDLALTKTPLIQISPISSDSNPAIARSSRVFVCFR
jgi:hypothetical protein